MAAQYGIQCGCCSTEVTTRRSMTCGNDRNEESRKAIMNRPGPPMATANAWIHASTVFIRTNLRLAHSSIHAPNMTEPPVEIITEPPRSPLALRIGALAAVWG